MKSKGYRSWRATRATNKSIRRKVSSSCENPTTSNRTPQSSMAPRQFLKPKQWKATHVFKGQSNKHMVCMKHSTPEIKLDGDKHKSYPSLEICSKWRPALPRIIVAACRTSQRTGDPDRGDNSSSGKAEIAVTATAAHPVEETATARSRGRETTSLTADCGCSPPLNTKRTSRSIGHISARDDDRRR